MSNAKLWRRLSRIRRLQARLARLAKRRGLARQQRLKQEVPTVSLVGYTNAGKSTLFNRLTDAKVYVADQLFATLDPTMRRVQLPVGGSFVLVDTVGFVRDLPHELVAAFRATLTETRDASLLLHVVDASDPYHEDRLRQVEDVLEQIGASEVPTIRVYNKIDQVGNEMELGPVETAKIAVSARTGEGLPGLISAIRAQVVGSPVVGRLELGPEQSRIRAKLFDWKAVRSEKVDAAGRWTLEVELSARRWRELRELEGLSRDRISQKA